MPNPNALARMEQEAGIGRKVQEDAASSFDASKFAVRSSPLAGAFEVAADGTLRRIADKVNELYALNGLDARARDVLMGLIPKQHGGYA